MQAEIQNKTVKPGKKNIILLSLIVFSLLMLATCAQLVYMTLKYDKVYKGVSINGMNVGGMSGEQAEAALKSQFQDKIDVLEIVVKTQRVEKNTKYTDLNVSYDMANAVEKAYKIGREGNIFQRLFTIINASFKGASSDMSLSYDSDRLNSLITDFYNITLINVKQPEVLIQDNKVTVLSGHHGENIDKEKLKSAIEEMIKNCQDGTIEVEVNVTEPTKLDVNSLYNDLNKEPVNASFKMEDGKTQVEPHIPGMKIEKAELERILTDLEKKEDTEAILPMQYIEPEITTENASDRMFKDQLAYYSTRFSTGNTNDRNRAENIKLVTESINGKILLPGDEFSFNETVGPRTEKRGYKAAHAYIAGKVVDEVGGGICQASSTLYGIVLKSDLEVTERRNHQFTVGYVPFGQDATVSYGTTDFRFKNNTGWPIRIEAGVTDKNDVYFRFIGTNTNPGKEVIITQEIVKKIPYETKYINDPKMLEGTTSVRQSGKEGYVVNTYKTVKIDGKVISEAKLHTSTYKPLTKEVLKGTKKPDATIPPTTTPEPTPVKAVDDASNPPAQD